MGFYKNWNPFGTASVCLKSILMQLGRFLNSCLNRWESQVASDDGQQPRVHASVRNQMHPKSPFGTLQGIWQRRRSLWRAFVLPQACEAVFYYPGNLLVQQDSYLEKRFSNGLELQMKEGSPGV